LRNSYVKGLLFVFFDGAIIILMILVVSEYPEPIGVIPEGLDKSSYACFSGLDNHCLSPKFCQFVGYSAF
jgi:hypothetical protein